MGRIVGMIFTLPVIVLVAVVAVVAASEWGGEVVHLQTHDARGREFQTSVWVLEQHGDIWIRGSDRESAWVQRLQVNPEVKLQRDQAWVRYRAEIVSDYADRLNDGMREKYGRADAITGWVRDPDQVVAIRLAEL